MKKFDHNIQCKDHLRVQVDRPLGASRGSRMAKCWLQNEAELLPGGSKISHYGTIGARRNKHCPQDGPKRHPRQVSRVPRAPHGPPGGLQGDPLGRPGGPKRGQEGPKRAPRGPKKGPKEFRKTKSGKSKNVKKTISFYCFLASWACQDVTKRAHLGSFWWLSGDLGVTWRPGDLSVTCQ